MELVDLAPALVGPDGTATSGFGVFDSALAAGGRVKAIVAPGMAAATRREIDELTELARRFGAAGLAHLGLEAGGQIKGPAARFLSARASAGSSREREPSRVISSWSSRATSRSRRTSWGGFGSSLPSGCSWPIRTCWPTSGSIASRCTSGTPSNGRWHATHNPFSGVLPEDETLLATTSGDPARPAPHDPAGRARALQYDLALNGWELGGGSIRIHRRDLLERSFLLQGHSLEAMHEKFGAVLEAFEYGAPPHGGIALGIDRWAALLADQTNIREVMAFPKTQSGTDLMLEAPSVPEPGQYEELGLRFVGVGGEGHPVSDMERPGALAAIGNTPAVRLSRLVEPGMAEVWVKLEAHNPTGSYKDRMALAMIEGAERSGRLRPGQTIVEYTGGSTGSSLAFVCSIKGYPLRIVSSDAYAIEKIRTMQAFGADVELIPSPEGITPT